MPGWVGDVFARPDPDARVVDGCDGAPALVSVLYVPGCDASICKGVVELGEEFG